MSRHLEITNQPSPRPVTPLENIEDARSSPLSKTMSLSDRLGLIALIDKGMRLREPETPLVSDLFSNLWELVNATVSGSRIDRLKPEGTRNGFKRFELNAETGENLGRLNMLYLKKPIPCYYLVYVEVAGPFRRKGLGNRILDDFKDFLVEKSAIGILDNIIPEEDPTYRIYTKQGWEPLEGCIGERAAGGENHLMIYVPPRWQGRELRALVSKMVHHLKRKRPAIDMRHNEMMVRQTIGEFRELYHALLTYFRTELETGKPTPLMQFMFTRFATKLVSFRRRIGTLLGYTGGESLEQIVLHPEIAALPVRTYPPPELTGKSLSTAGDGVNGSRLPDRLRENPARFIESLPNYGRPSLKSWLKERGRASTDTLTIGDLMDLGFDPTRLKEITLDEEEFIFERLQARQMADLKKKKLLLKRIESEMPDARPFNARLRVNPPLLAIQDRGNAYVLRRKVSGIHWEEAIEQLQSDPCLRSMNATAKIDRLILATVRRAHEMISEKLSLREETVSDLLTCFVPWDLVGNQPRLMIDFASTYLESLWMA